MNRNNAEGKVKRSHLTAVKKENCWIKVQASKDLEHPHARFTWVSLLDIRQIFAIKPNRGFCLAIKLHSWMSDAHNISASTLHPVKSQR